MRTLKKKITYEKYEKKDKLTAGCLLKITNIFAEKKWPVIKEETDEQSLFNRFCKRVADIHDNETRNLMLELTRRYLWIEEEQYINYLVSALRNLVKSNNSFVTSDKVYVMPLVAPEDENKIKSSTAMVYMFNSVKLRHDQLLSKVKFEIVSKKDTIKKKMDEGNAILLLVDDYIGTGGTAEKCVLDFQTKGIDISRIYVVALVAQQSGLEYLRKYDINISASLICRRGISDYYKGDELKKNKKLMCDLEKKLEVSDTYKFGYLGSEALVTMCRTPNNTFPVFWKESKNMKTAPFPRF